MSAAEVGKIQIISSLLEYFAASESILERNSKIVRTCVKMAGWGQNVISGWYIYHFCVTSPYC